MATPIKQRRHQKITHKDYAQRAPAGGDGAARLKMMLGRGLDPGKGLAKVESLALQDGKLERSGTQAGTSPGSLKRSPPGDGRALTSRRKALKRRCGLPAAGEQARRLPGDTSRVRGHRPGSFRRTRCRRTSSGYKVTDASSSFATK